MIKQMIKMKIKNQLSLFNNKSMILQGLMEIPPVKAIQINFRKIVLSQLLNQVTNKIEVLINFQNNNRKNK